MGAWDLIEEKLDNQLIPIYLTNEEYALVEAALSSLIKSRLNEGASAWSIFEQLAEAGSMKIPVKGLSKQAVDLIRRKFPTFASQFKQGNTGYLMMVEPNLLKSIRDQLQRDPQFSGLAPIEEFLDKATQALELVQGSAMAKAGRAQAPELPGKSSDPTALAKSTGFNDPSVKGSVPPRFTGSTAQTPPPRQMQPSITHEPSAIGGPATPFTNKAKVAAQDVTGSAGAQQAGVTDWSKGKTTVLDPKKQQKTADMEDPEKWFENLLRRSQRRL